MTQSADLTLGAISNLIQQKELSVTEVVNNYLDRIKQFESTLKAWVSVDEENALAKARVLDKAVRGDNNRSLLHGIPFGVKDIFWVNDSVTSAGSPIYRDFVPRQDATVVGNLVSAGAIFLGNTVTTEFAPIFEFLPTKIGPRTFAPAPITTLSEIVGCLFFFSHFVPPNVTPWYLLTLLPMIVVSPITMPIA